MLRYLTGFALGLTLSISPAVYAADGTCEVGAYIISLHDIDLAKDSFGADLWFWSTCEQDLRPLDVMDFPTAKQIQTSLSATDYRSGKYWSYVKVSGVFRHDWDMSNFPFDRQILSIEVEHTAAPANEFTYMPDIEGSKPGKDIELDGWGITGFDVTSFIYNYDTAFGDPSVNGKETSDYARMAINTSIERETTIGFFKLTAGVYVSFALALFSFFLGDEIGSRMGLLVGTLFAVLVNQRVAETVLGRVESFTLVDLIHVTAMFFIFAASLVAILHRVPFVQERGYDLSKLDKRAALLSGGLYVIVNALIIGSAAYGN